MTHEQLSAIETRIEKLKEARWESVVSLVSTIAHDDAPALLAEAWSLRAELEAAKRVIKHFLQLSRDDWMSGDEWCGLCEMCEHVNREVCKSCDDAEWRGVTENGGAE